MSIRSRVGLVSAALALTTLAGAANATFFSFASDNTDNNSTFLGSAAAAGSFAITSPANNKFNLLVDDNNGPRPFLTIPTTIKTDLHSSFVSVGGFGSFTTYNYGIFGTVDFMDQATGLTLLMRITVSPNGPALMTVTGSPTSWSTAGAIIGSDPQSLVGYNITQAGFNAVSAAATGLGQTAAGYGVIAPGDSAAPNDFGFSLTALMRQSGALSVTVDQTGLPNVAWQSESSYSGSSGNFLPSPSATALLGMAGLLSARRRRS